MNSTDDPTKVATSITTTEDKVTNEKQDYNDSKTTMMAFAGQLSLPTPQSDSIQSQLRRNSMPNPDVIRQHITDIISRNSAIVGDYNPWNHRKNSSSSSTATTTTTNSTAKQPSLASNSDLEQEINLDFQHHKNQSSLATTRKRWSTSGPSPSKCINKYSATSSYNHIGINNKAHNKFSTLDFNNQYQTCKKTSNNGGGVGGNNNSSGRYSTPHRNQRKSSISALNHHRQTSIMNQEQPMPNFNHLVELAKLDSVLRGQNATQEKLSASSNSSSSPSNFINDQIFDPFSIGRHNTFNSFNLGNHLSQHQQQKLISRFNSSNACPQTEQLILKNSQSDADLIQSIIQSHVANPERRYYSADSLINRHHHNNPNDRRHSLNHYSFPLAYHHNGNGLEQDSRLTSEQLTAYLWELKIRQELSMISQQSCYGGNHSPDSFLSTPQLDNIVMAQKRDNSMTHNFTINNQTYNSINSSQSINANGSSSATQNHPIDYRESSYRLRKPNATAIDQRDTLRIAQESEESLIREFLNNLQNVNTRIPTRIHQISNDHFTNISNGLKNYTDTHESVSRTKTISNNDALSMDFSYLNNHQKTSDTSIESKPNMDINTNTIHVCKLCRTTFRNLDTLMAHQAHYCRLSDSARKFIPDLMMSATLKPYSTNEASTPSQKFRRNSSALGDLAEKVRNVFVTNSSDQPIDLHSNAASPRRVSKSISPTQLSGKIDILNSNDINTGQTSTSISPTSPTKNHTSILKQQLLGSCATIAQSLPPKKRKISEPNLKLAGFNVGATNTPLINRVSPDPSLPRKNDEHGLWRQISCDSFNLLSKGRQSNEPCELDLSNRKGSKVELSLNDSEDLEDDLYGSDIFNISKKQCSPTRNTRSDASTNVSPDNGKSTIYLEKHKLDLNRHLEIRRNSDYMPHGLDSSARVNFSENLQLPTLKANSELEMSLVNQIG